MKKPPLYLHIGMGKTGTTALQFFFAQNRESLLARGVDYPDYHCEEGAHHRLSPHIPPFLAQHWEFLGVHAWGPVLAARDRGTLLLSSELMSSAQPAVVSKFGSEVLEYFDGRIVIYLRRQDHLIASTYNQQIKAGTQTAPFDVMLERQFSNFDFTRKLEPWIKAFGKQNVIVVPYERSQFHEGDIRKDFLKRVFGIEDWSALVFETQDRNPGLAASAAEFKRLVNCAVRDSGIANRFNGPLHDYSSTLTSEMAEAFDPMPPSVRRQVLRRCDDVNRTIAKEHLGRADGRLFIDPEPDDGARCPETELSKEELVRIIRYLGEHQPQLIQELRGQIARAESENRFESYFAGRKLEAGIVMSELGGGKSRMDETLVVAAAYATRKGTGSDPRMTWINDREFEVGGCRFTIDTTAGNKRRISEPNNFTIVKTKKFFGSYLDLPLPKAANILELGIFQGGSLAFMERLFEPSRIVGIDLAATPVAALELFKEGHPAVATYYGVSQDDETKVCDIIRRELGGAIDLVVDDASHLYEQTRKSFEIVFPFVKPGGLYVIEDWAWSFRPLYQSPENSWYPKPAMANLIFELIADIGGNNAIESMFIHENMAIVRKSTAANAVPPLRKSTYRDRALPQI